jgi:hypothetical protein
MLKNNTKFETNYQTHRVSMWLNLAIKCFKLKHLN